MKKIRLNRKNIKQSAIQLLALAITVCMLPMQIAVSANSEREPGYYIVTANSADDLPELRSALSELGAKIIYSYERALTGFYVYAEDASAIDALEKSAQVIIPQRYRTLAADSMLTEEQLEKDELAAAGAISALEGYNGAGVVIAVLDDGFSTDEKWLLTGDTASCAIAKHDIARNLRELCASEGGKLRFEEVWRRWKVPFAYDYAGGDTDVSPDGSSSHGNEIASCIGANSLGGDDCTDGAAPGAQLLLMKVASERVINEGVLLAALDDALLLGADVINFSLGEALTGGLDGTPGTALAKALENAEAAGVSVVCAAGNDGESGGGIWKDLYGITQPTVSLADHGSVTQLASLPSVTAVGSIDYYYRSALCLENADGMLFTYSDSSAVYLKSGLSFTGSLDGKRLEYVPVPGIGKMEDYKGIDVDGKLALIERGEFAFTEKLEIAAQNGAVGAIIYNNEPNAALVTMQIDNAPIPAVFVTLETGELLIASETRELVITEGKTMQIETEGGGNISAFSSRGVTSSLMIAPDLCAFGGNVRVPSAETQYDAVSGTSYSAALISGYTAVLLQYRRSMKLDTAPEALRRALMNSAAVITREETVVSPRAQGAGLCDLSAAAALTIEVSDAAGRGSVSLGEIGDEAEFTLKVTNLTNKTQNFKLSAAVVTDGAVSRTYDEENDILLPSESSDKFPYFVSGESVRLDGASVSVSGTGGNINEYSDGAVKPSFSVGAGEELTLTFRLNCGELPFDIFTYGCYVEGMLQFEPDNGSKVSLPFCGFSGDWGALPVMDSSAYDGGQPLYGGAYLYTYCNSYYYSGERMLGTNDFDERAADVSLAAISPNRDGSCEYVELRMPLLRDAELLRYEIEDSAGKVVFRSEEYRGLRRSSLAGNVDLAIWDGSDPDNSSYVYPDGKYSLHVYVTPVGGTEQTLSFDFILDTGLPEIKDIVLEDSELSFNVSDSIGVQSITVYTMDEDGLWRGFTEYIVPDVGEIMSSEISLDVSETLGKYIYIEVYDYAGNNITHRIKNES